MSSGPDIRCKLGNLVLCSFLEIARFQYAGNTFNNLPHPLSRQRTDFLFQTASVYREQLCTIDDALLGQVTFSRKQQDISTYFGAFEIRSQQANNSGVNTSAIHSIVLYHNTGSPVARFGAKWGA